jgi:hypothetical protein
LASVQSPLHFPQNALAQRWAASNKYEAAAACGEFLLKKQSIPSPNTQGGDRRWMVQAAGKPLDQGGVYRSEGFG